MLFLLVKMLLHGGVLIRDLLEALQDVILVVVGQFKLWLRYRQHEHQVKAMFSWNRSDSPTTEDVTWMCMCSWRRCKEM